MFDGPRCPRRDRALTGSGVPVRDALSPSFQHLPACRCACGHGRGSVDKTEFGVQLQLPVPVTQVRAADDRFVDCPSQLTDTTPSPSSFVSLSFPFRIRFFLIPVVSFAFNAQHHQHLRFHILHIFAFFLSIHSAPFVHATSK